MILTLHRLSIPGQGELCDSSGLKLRSLILFSSLKKPFFLTRIDLSRLKLDQTTGKVWWKKKQRILDGTHKRSPVGSCHRTLVLLNMFLEKKKKASVDEFATDGVRYPYISQVIQGELLSCISLRESPVSHSLKKGILSIHKRNCESLPKYRPKTKW